MIACVQKYCIFRYIIDESFLCTLDSKTIEAFIDSLRNALDYVSVALVVTNKSRQDTAACASLSFVYNVKQQGIFRPRQATDNSFLGFPFYREAGF